LLCKVNNRQTDKRRIKQNHLGGGKNCLWLRAVLFLIFILGSTSYFESFIITGSYKSIVVQQWSQKVRTNNKFTIEIL